MEAIALGADVIYLNEDEIKMHAVEVFDVERPWQNLKSGCRKVRSRVLGHLHCYTAARGTNLARGLITNCSRRCSKTCAIQPAMRPNARRPPPAYRGAPSA
jgi:hypothetical protein